MTMEQMIEDLVKQKIREYLNAPDVTSVDSISMSMLVSNVLTNNDKIQPLSTDYEMTNTAQSVLDEYIKDHLSQIKTGLERERQLRRMLQPFMPRAFASITQREVANMLTEWNGATYNRHKAAATHLWRWAREREYTYLTPTISAKKEQSRDMVLSLTQLRSLYKAADKRGDWAGFAKLLILTGQRRGDVMGLLPIHIKKFEWHQPTSKNGMPHIVPLTQRSKGLVLEYWAMDQMDWTGKNSYSDFKRRWFTDAGVPLHYRLHDIRRSFATRLCEAGHPIEIVDRCLNHVGSASSTGISRVYNKAQNLDQRREVMAAWDRLLFPDD